MGKKGAHFGASLVMQNCKPQDPLCQSVLAFGATLLCQNLDGKMNIINILYIYVYIYIYINMFSKFKEQKFVPSLKYIGGTMAETVSDNGFDRF